MPRRTALLCCVASGLLLACGKDAASTAATATASASPPRATAAAPTTATATAVATAAPAAGGACSVVGEWKGTYPPGPYPFSGTKYEFSLKSDGTGLTHSARADSELAWKVEGGTFSLHKTKTDNAGRFTCTKEQIGKYGFTFTPDCSSLTLKVQQDPCRGRTMTMDGAVMTRK